MNTNSPKRDEGMALILSLIFLVAMAIMITSVADRTRNQTNQVSRYVDFENTMSVVEAGLAEVRAELQNIGNMSLSEDERDGLVGLSGDFDLTSARPTFDDNEVTPQSLPSMPNAEFFAYAIDWSDDGIDNNGDGTADENAEQDYFSVYSVARADATMRQVETIVEGSNVNIWTNAIFAGSGQGGNLINGNVSIHGAVHLLGDALSDGDIAVAALDLSGTSLIHNNYDGIPSHLEDRVPPLPQTTFDGQTVDTLEAKLRVKNGLVGLSGNSEVGQPQDTSNDFKETMDAIYVTDGWTGNGLDGNGDPINVWSDNGHDEEYDLGGAVDFPTFPDDGGRDHLAYYLETDAAGTGLQVVHNGDIEIDAGDNYYWNATMGVEAADTDIGTGNMPQLADIPADQYYIWFDADADHLVINGRIPVDGNVVLDRGSGNDKTINYSGKGSILAYDADGSGDGGDVNLQVSLYTVNLDGSTSNSFPSANLLGLMAEDDMVIGSNSQLEIMGGFYAQDTISVDKQTTIMGTIVGNVFDMGTNVPDIFQVPELADEWWNQQRMIGADPVLFLNPVSWRELGVL